MCLFLEREGREEEKEKNIEWLPLTHLQLGTWPTNQACALTGIQTSNILVHGPALSPLSHTSQCVPPTHPCHGLLCPGHHARLAEGTKS